MVAAHQTVPMDCAPHLDAQDRDQAEEQRDEHPQHHEYAAMVMPGHHSCTTRYQPRPRSARE
jgi:hypothetical protein